MTANRPMIALIVVLTIALAGAGPGLVGAEPPPSGLASPGGIAALPSALPALAPIIGMFAGQEQVLPAFAPASGPGSFAIVDAFCATGTGATIVCPWDEEGNVIPITFTMSRVYPPGGPAAASFTENGLQTLDCLDDDACDLTDWVYELQQAQVQHVAVGLTGGGVNEVIEVTACDGSGDCRSVTVVFVETILAVPPMTSALYPSLLVSYRCSDVGLYDAPAGIPQPVPGEAITGAQASPEVTWEEVFDWQYGMSIIGSGRLRSPLTALPMPDIPFYSCGGDTASPVDDRVNFDTDLGILSVEAFGDLGSQVLSGLRLWGTLSAECDLGDSVDVLDHPGPIVNSRGFVSDPIVDPLSTFCDLDFAPNGVVTYGLLPAGGIGVATVAAQQTGGGGTLRTINVTFVGPPTLMLFMTGGDLTNGDNNPFTVVVVDEDGRPVPNEAVDCQTALSAPFYVAPPTAATGQDGQALFDPGLVEATPNIVGGEEFDLTCVLQSDPSVSATERVMVPLWWDADGDGCSGTEELSIGFDPFAWHDVYDVPVPAVADPSPNGARDQVVDIRDTLAVLLYAFTEPMGACGDNPNSNGVDYDCDKNGDTAVDGREYDRSPGVEPNPPWEAAPPDDVVDIRDVLAALAQAFVVDCSEAP